MWQVVALLFLLFLFPANNNLLGQTKKGVVAPSKAKVTGSRLRVEKGKIFDPSGKQIRLRGVNVTWWTKPTAKDAKMIKKMGFNMVRYVFHYEPGSTHKLGKFDPTSLSAVKEHVRLFTAEGLWVIPTEWKFRLNDDKINIWNTPKLRVEFGQMWKYVIEQLKDEDYIAAYEPENEPHTEHWANDDALLKWYRDTIKLIRSLDATTPIVVGGNNYSNAVDIDDDLKMKDPYVIYTFHVYDPREYTHIAYKDRNKLEWPKSFATNYHDRMFADVSRFQKKFDVPIYLGEFGAMTYAKGNKAFISDIVRLAERHGFHWSHWSWRHTSRESKEFSYFDGDKVLYKTDMIDFMSGLLLQANKDKSTAPPAKKRKKKATK